MRKGMLILVAMLVVVPLIGLGWEKFSWIKEGVHSVLDPTFGALLDKNKYLGLIIAAFVVNLVSSGIQKMTVNSEELKAMKEKQKSYQEELKKHQNDKLKQQELMAKQFAEMPDMFFKNFEIFGKSLLPTAILFILTIRWFSDYFSAFEGLRFLGFMSWFWFYFLLIIFLSIPVRKVYKL